MSLNSSHKHELPRGADEAVPSWRGVQDEFSTDAKGLYWIRRNSKCNVTRQTSIASPKILGPDSRPVALDSDTPNPVQSDENHKKFTEFDTIIRVSMYFLQRISLPQT
jgi:hypothetical protein